MVRRLMLPLALLAAAAAAAPGFADRDQALDRVDEAEAAMKDKAYPAAERLYRQALEAMDTCLPALLGLGEALLAQERKEEAIVPLRAAVRAGKGSDALPVAWKDCAGRAAKHLAQIDEHGRELDEIIDRHVAELVKLAVAQRRKDPDLADRALDIALTLRPDHKRARELRGKLSEVGARREAVFDGKQIEDWDGGRAEWWSVTDGVIVGETKGIATFIRTQEEVSGNFDLVMEARIAKVYDKSPFIALMGAWKAEFNHSRFGVLVEALTWFEKHSENDSEQIYRCPVDRLPKPVDAAAWNTYELQFRSDKITAVINGKEVHSIDRTAERAGGYVGILAQGCRAEIRKVEVVHR